MKRILKRVLLALAIVVVVLASGLWLARHEIANRVLDDALRAVTTRADQFGITLHDLRSGEVEIPTPATARVPDVRTDFGLGRKGKARLRSRFEADVVEARLAGLFPPRARLQVEGFSLRFHPDDLPEKVPFEAFDEARFVSSALPLTDAAAAVKQMVSGLAEMFEENAVRRDFDLSGTVELDLGELGKSKARLYTEVLPDGSRRLRFDEDDLRAVAKQADVTLAEDEVEIVSVYPLRAPVIVLITARAKHVAAERRAGDPSFPEDAFRHLTWSFLLTKTFGAEFAKRVTDAHETLPNNTEDERAMDYHNNALAREWAENGVKEADILRRLGNDPRVVRFPREVGRQEELLR